MSELIVISRDGRQTIVDGLGGRSVMENIKEAGLDELLAICGGVCACATCHVYVDPAFGALVGPTGEDEDELLSGSDHRRPESRLSCQIPFDDRLAGLKVQIAPED
jgi:2Fe-2S ferredoxin